MLAKDLYSYLERGIDPSDAIDFICNAKNRSRVEVLNAFIDEYGMSPYDFDLEKIQD